MTELIETGVKAVDLYAPLARGGRLAIGGEPGSGQLVVAFEITRNVMSRGRLSALYLVSGDVEEFKRALREAGVEAAVVGGDNGTRCELLEDGGSVATLLVWTTDDADSHVVLTRELVRRGQLPGVDAAQSGSRLELGEHGELAAEARRAIAGETLAGAAVLAFVRQWFTVAEPWTGQPGEYSTLANTLAGVRQLVRPG